MPHALHAQALWEYTKDLDISPVQPWMLQQLLSGTEYSSYTVAHRGHVLAHSDNEACLSCLDYEHVDSQQARDCLSRKVPGNAALLCLAAGQQCAVS
jgi:hypothetical protein